MDLITKRPLLFLLAGVVLISFSPIFVKASQASALSAGFYRNLFGGLLLLPLVLIRKDSWQRGKWTILLPLLAGVLFFVDLWGWHMGIGYIGPGLATLIGNFQVFFVTLFGVVFLGERLTVRFLLAIPLALGGVFFIGQSGHADDGHLLAGVLLCLLAAMCYAVFLMINRKAQSHKNRLSAEMNLLYITLSSGILFGLAMGATGESFALESSRMFLFLAAYGFIPHFFGWIIIIRCLPLVKATVAGMMLLLQPVLTFAWEVILFGKQFSPSQLAGCALAIVAIYMGTAKSKVKQE
ncbi:MAG: DMT family transporter [Deltaproteobacteria bacterium]|nr:DMT family transporter [Deltaproteobacteria bacterium]